METSRHLYQLLKVDTRYLYHKYSLSVLNVCLYLLLIRVKNLI